MAHGVATRGGVVGGQMLLLALTAHGVAPVQAQAIDTNRPGFSFSPAVLAAGRLQLETAFSHYSRDDEPDILSVPNAELRYGVGAHAELFLSGLSWSRERGGLERRGFGDVAVGTKVALVRGSSPVRLSLLLLASAPSGDEPFTSDRWDTAAGVVWTHAGALPLAGTLKVTDLAGTFRVDNGLKLPWVLDEQRSAFVEWEANLPEQGSDSHWLNTGFQWLLSDRTQVDCAVDVNVHGGGGFRIGLGLSFRL